MSSTVYFADLRSRFNKNMAVKIRALLAKAPLGEVVLPQQLAAVKVHFGETGNTAYIRPVYIRFIVDTLMEAGAKPFLTDTNTLYRGARSDAVTHTVTALVHGFNYTTVNAPVIIADGLRGSDAVKVRINGKHVKEAYIAAGVVRADSLISVAHVKGHELTGFGGTLKNIGMGCASRQGKMEQHCDISPAVIKRKCASCGTCIPFCPAAAITMGDTCAVIDPDRCIGCAECITVCPREAIQINWNESSRLFQEKMVEYAGAVLESRKGRALFLNFIMQVSPACDCYPFADRPVVPDIGILMSRDPVALDQASVDMINAEQGVKGSALQKNFAKKQDKFIALYPEVDWTLQLRYAEEFKLGSRQYTIERV